MSETEVTKNHVPASLEAWRTLTRLAQQCNDDANSFAEAPQRNASGMPTLEISGLTLDFSRQRVPKAAFTALQGLAQQCRLGEAIQRQFRGARVNVTEDSAVLHTALRAPYQDCPAELRDEIREQRHKLIEFANQLRRGKWCGHTGKAIETLVHIGIGGSHLGPEFACDALQEYNDSGIELRFLSSIDGHQLDRVLAGLDAATTLCVIVSKSFTTLETRCNAEALRSWFLERTGSVDAMQHHFVAVSSNASAAVAFGIAKNNIFTLWDWVGGRFSIWSSVGLPLAVTLGETRYRAFLRGAHILDHHVATAPLAENAPLLLALVAIWNSNFLAVESHAVLAYDHRLKLLSAHLQQLEMESLGKSVHSDGTPCAIATGCILWGGEEPQGQHAYHQLLHQGSRCFSADFIACLNADHRHPQHHDWLLASCLSQGQAFLEGKSLEQLADDPLAAHKALPGNHPSTTILLKRLTPGTLGELLALYEHKVMCLGILLDINSWDQWGVETGKTLAQNIHAELVAADTQKERTKTGLIGQIRKNRQQITDA